MKYIILLFLCPLLSFGQEYKTDDQLNHEADSIKNVIGGRTANNSTRLARMWKNMNKSKPNKLKPFTLTTTGTSGAATLVDSTLNIPNYVPSLPGASAGILYNDGADNLSWVPNPLSAKTMNIGDWNMDATSSVSVAHGLTAYKIRAIQVIVRNDAITFYYPIVMAQLSDGLSNGAVANFDATNILLSRFPGGIFDSTNFDSTSGFNRGSITIWYEQ